MREEGVRFERKKYVVSKWEKKMILRWHFWVYNEKNDQRKKSYKKTIGYCILVAKKRFGSHILKGAECAIKQNIN